MSNKVLVTGSSRGIGKRLGLLFAENEWDVCFTSRHKKDLIKISDNFKNKNHLFYPIDFLFLDEILNLRNYLKDTWEKLDSLIINLGSGSGPKTIGSKFTENLQLFELNFYTAFYTSQLFLSLLRKSENPSIIFVGSIAANTNVRSPINYAMAKKSLENYSIHLSKELSNLNIRVNCVNLSHVLTENGYWDKIQKSNQEYFNQLITANALTGKFFEPVEIASFIFFLTNSCSTRNLTGNIFTLDCGVIKNKKS